MSQDVQHNKAVEHRPYQGATPIFLGSCDNDLHKSAHVVVQIGLIYSIMHKGG